MSSRRWRGGDVEGVENGGVHTRSKICHVAARPRDKSNEVNGGFMQTGAFISLLTGQVPSSVSTPSLLSPSFFFSSLLTAHFCHACGANRRPPSQRPPFLIYRERTWGERRGGESHLSAISRIRCGWSAVINLVTDLSFSLFVGFQIRLI